MESTAGTGTSTDSAAVPSAPGPERVPLTVPAAAQALGIKERAVRKRITAGTLEAVRDGARWLVYLPAPDGTESGTHVGTIGTQQEQPTAPIGTGAASPAAAIGSVTVPLSYLQERDRQILELAGQVAYLQRVVQEKDGQIRLLQAPPPEAVTAAPETARRPFWRRLWK